MPEAVRRVLFGALAGLAFMVAMFGVWRAAFLPDPESWRFARLCLGAVIAFGVCRYFLARSSLVTRFVVPMPTDPDRLRTAPRWLLPAVCIAGAASLALVGL